MKPKGKEYAPRAFISKWERIEDSHYLIQVEVSDYIRKLEGTIKDLNRRNMSEFKQYKRKEVAELKEVTKTDTYNYTRDGRLSSGSLTVSISDADLENGSPKIGDMIARNPKNHEDQWLVAEKYFNDNFEEI